LYTSSVLGPSLVPRPWSSMRTGDRGPFDGPRTKDQERRTKARAQSIRVRAIPRIRATAPDGVCGRA
jgi:hypothetical protein